MKYDAIRSARELRQAADMAVPAAIGWLASAILGFSLWLTIGAAFVIIRPWRQQGEGMLLEKPTIRLAILALILVWLASDWSSYRQGVFAGYDEAGIAAQR